MNRPEREVDRSTTYIAKQYGSVKLQPYRPSACSQYAAYCFIKCFACNVYYSRTTLPPGLPTFRPGLHADKYHFLAF